MSLATWLLSTVWLTSRLLLLALWLLLLHAVWNTILLLLHETILVLVWSAIWHSHEHWVELLLWHLLKLRHSWHALHLTRSALHLSHLRVLTIFISGHHGLHLLQLHEILLTDEPTDLRVGSLVKLLQFLDITTVSELLDVLLSGEVWSRLSSLVLLDQRLQL